jgi:hypothetical protein
MVARPSVIFGDGTKNFLDDDLLVGALRSIREVGAPGRGDREPAVQHGGQAQRHLW